MDSDQGKIFVGGISWETSEEKLKEYFNCFGSVLEAVIMKDRTTGRARGFGFVAFADPDVADKVLHEKHTIDGRVVEVKKAVPRDERQNSSKSNGSPVTGNHNRTKKIFVGGLASSVTEDDFRNYFSQFGNITDVVVMYDPDTQRPRGFGFITFDSEDAVEKVLQQKTFHEIHEKLVEVKKAVPREISVARSNNGTGFVASRGATYNNGYGQAGNPNSANGYSSGGRYAPPPPPNGRGGYPPYSLSPYGPAYAAAPGYGMPMNGMFGAATPYGGPGYPPAGAYGAGYGNNPATAYGGAGYGPPGGYGGAPHIGVGPRSPWGNGGGGFGGSSGSPTAYGAGAPNGYSGANGYGGPGWNSAGSGPQVNGAASGYGSYTTSEVNHYANGTAAYPPHSGGVGYGDHYGNAGSGPQYADGSWKSGESHASPASSAGAGYSAGVGMGSGSPVAAIGYGTSGRQSQRGPDARFRPYTVNGERAA